MKTFHQFTYDCFLILEKYYGPYEKLPSGRTPLGKAKKRGITGDLLRKVERGADSKDFDESPHNDVTLSKQFGTTTITDKKTGLAYDITDKPKINNEPHYDISWWDLRGEAKTPEERRALALRARTMWHKNVQPRFPYGSVVSNTPASETHEDAYRRAGFGPILRDPNLSSSDDRVDRQYATVGRMPSPKQQAKGKKSRLSPMDPPKERQRRH